MNEENMKEIIYNDSLTAREKYKMLYGEDVSRDRARHTIDKLKMGGWVSDSTRPVVVTYGKDGSIGSEKVLECSEGELADAVFLLKAHGFDPGKFVLENARSSMWNGGKGGKTLYSSRIRVRPKKFGEDVVSLLEENVAELTAGIAGKVGIDVPMRGKELLEVCIADMHIGLVSGGGDDIALEHERVGKLIGGIVDVIRRKRMTSCILSFLGDILHYDNDHRTTTAGTQQEGIAVEKAYNNALKYVNCLISEVYGALSDNCNGVDPSLTVVYVPGNHDRVLGYTLMAAMRVVYAGKVTFIADQKDRKIVKYGSNLIGYTHGDMNKKRVLQWIYSDGRELLGGVENIEIHAGHLHSEGVVEENGLILRYVPTMAGVSPWEYKEGYSSKRKVEMFLWDENEGLIGIEFIHM